ncbi:MAG: EF-hand domain-containing protein [Pseudomonadota bacterium]
MTKLHLAIPAVLVGLSLSPAMAQEVADADGNGTYSLEELMVSYPSLTAEVYATIDTNADGAVDATELKAAQDAGTLKAG